ncbi:hypothetical protein D3C85_1716090 [compost metagenome]
MCEASSRLMPTCPVMSGILVMVSLTLRSGNSDSGMKRVSRLVTMPSRRPSVSTTGRPETR